jgi:hypothetical protein
MKLKEIKWKLQIFLNEIIFEEKRLKVSRLVLFNIIIPLKSIQKKYLKRTKLIIH